MIPADLGAERQRVLGLANGIKAAADRQEYLYENGDAESYFEDELRKYAAVVAELERAREDAKNATQALIYAVQAHPQGDVGKDWSSWRVGFGRGVSRGYGNSDLQQIISAVCQATKHDDPHQIPTIAEFHALAALAPAPEGSP